MKSGIYKIINIVNNKCYIGSSEDITNRRYHHFSLLKHNKHHSIHLQNAFNKYGKDNFIFEVLDYVSNTNNLLKYEQLWINQLKPEYNICKIAGRVAGYKHTKETKQLISEKLKGIFIGKFVSEETRQKQSKTRKGRKICVGSKNGRSKLDDQNVIDIRKDYQEKTVKELMKQYSVSKRTIDLILRGKSWTHITNGVHIFKLVKYKGRLLNMKKQKE